LQISTLVIWALRTIGPVALFRAGKALPELGARLAELADAVDGFDELIHQRPLNELSAGHEEDETFIPFLYEVLKHPLPDEWTDSILLNDRHSSVKVPALIIAGWYDLLLGADLEHFAGMQSSGSSEVARNNTRIIIGPWSHAMFMNMVGQVDFGFRSSGLFLDMKEDLTSLNLRWFEPPARSRQMPWYLGDNASFGPLPPSAESPPASYVYDPEDPCPTCGGTLLMPSHYTPGPVDQSPILGRRDLLVFTSEVLTDDLELAGAVTAQLYADWMIKLCDLRPDGTTINICDGVIRTSYQVHQTGKPFAPGEVVQWNIDLLATAMVFQAGHRLRVIISSSDFPRYDRNPNTGEQAVTAVSSVSALQRIYHDERYPSQLLLPVIS